MYFNSDKFAKIQTMKFIYTNLTLDITHIYKQRKRVTTNNMWSL